MKITREILVQAKILWDYHKINDPLTKADLIFCLGSFDIRSAQRAAEIYLQGYSNKVLFSGGIAHANDLLRTTWQESEAIVFAREAIKLGVPEKDILLETQATNTSENIIKGFEVIQKNHFDPHSIILVQKPYMGRRTYATFKKRWPNPDIKIMVTSLQISFEEYLNVAEVEKERIINLMVGDLQRLEEYPARGFQLYQDIPSQVWEAFEWLVEQGFTAHLIKTL